MYNNFVNDDFNVPLTLETDLFKLKKLTPDYAELDYDAVMSSKENLRNVFSINDDWPAENMTLNDNIKDLQRHEQDFDKRTGFTYTVLNHDESQCLGCVYIYRTITDYNAVVFFWVRDSELKNELDKKLFAALKKWLNEKWSLERIAFPTWEIPLKKWMELVEISK